MYSSKFDHISYLLNLRYKAVRVMPNSLAAFEMFPLCFSITRKMVFFSTTPVFMSPGFCIFLHSGFDWRKNKIGHRKNFSFRHDDCPFHSVLHLHIARKIIMLQLFYGFGIKIRTGFKYFAAYMAAKCLASSIISFSRLRSGGTTISTVFIL